MSLVTRRMRKHAYQLERRATEFPSDRISCDTGPAVLLSDVGGDYVCVCVPPPAVLLRDVGRDYVCVCVP